ncbi:MAG: preprotein translocase subunit SecG, partial [Clostridia bacterium]|nr:preprotein translocase subunit SecG [Clostridia bacterium]
MSVVFNIILILASLALIILVLMQEGNKQGLGAIGGAAETFLGKNKAKSYEGKLLNLTRILAAVFVVLAVQVTRLNA